jgi:hypothetical protein
MKHIRLRIIDLLDLHKGTLDRCEGCEICEEINELSKHLDRDSEKRFDHILSKGLDMTKSDIAFLIENETPIRTIRAAIDLTTREFNDMMRNYGFSRNYDSGGRKEMAQHITVEEFVQLHHIEGKSHTEIAQLKGMKKNGLSQWKWLNKTKIQESLQALNLGEITVEKSNVTKSEQVVKTIENQPLNDELLKAKNEIEDLKKQVHELEYLHAACDDVETELASLKDELEQERKAKEEAYQKAFDIELTLGLRISELEAQLSECSNNTMSVSKVVTENKAIKELLKLYL